MHHDLMDIQILVVDCQTTGGRAAKSHLIEIGWMPVRARDASGAEPPTHITHIIRQPQNIEPPKHIQRLTGITTQHFKNAIDPQAAWQALRTQAREVASSNQRSLCPVVIHFARFEMAFLRILHAGEKRSTPFPLEVSCSHQMAARVWPQLPRKGLRAVAGYLGHSVPPLKRCGSHLHATATIWRHLVMKLKEEFGVTSLEALRNWMLRPVEAGPVARIFPMPREMRLSAPARPGIYHFKRSNDDLLYIGKARSLKHRINSYFQAHRHHSESTLEMLTQAVKLQITPTHTAMEAALLESDEIKRLKPPYNKALVNDGRTLRFFSKNFKHQASHVDDRCPLGPVPSSEYFTALCDMGRLLMAGHSGPDSIHASHILCMPKDFAPDESCFRQGLDLFRSENGVALRSGNLWRALIRIGHQSWIESISRKEESIASQELSEIEKIATDPAPPFVWTPEAVSKKMTSILRRCGFLLRRSRWLILLSESTIAWDASDNTENKSNILILQHGKIAHRVRTSKTEPPEPPPPPGGQLSPRARQAHIDLPTYDRLRVLTTELRRLVGENRAVNIFLNRRAAINNRHLRRLFRWI